MSQTDSNVKTEGRKSPPQWVPKVIGAAIVLVLLSLVAWWAYGTFFAEMTGRQIVVGTNDPPAGPTATRGMFNGRAQQRRMQDNSRGRMQVLRDRPDFVSVGGGGPGGRPQGGGGGGGGGGAAQPVVAKAGNLYMECTIGRGVRLTSLAEKWVTDEQANVAARIMRLKLDTAMAKSIGMTDEQVVSLSALNFPAPINRIPVTPEARAEIEVAAQAYMTAGSGAGGSSGGDDAKAKASEELLALLRKLDQTLVADYRKKLDSMFAAADKLLTADQLEKFNKPAGK